MLRHSEYLLCRVGARLQLVAVGGSSRASGISIAHWPAVALASRLASVLIRLGWALGIERAQPSPPRQRVPRSVSVVHAWACRCTSKRGTCGHLGAPGCPRRAQDVRLLGAISCFLGVGAATRPTAAPLSQTLGRCRPVCITERPPDFCGHRPLLVSRKSPCSHGVPPVLSVSDAITGRALSGQARR